MYSRCPVVYLLAEFQDAALNLNPAQSGVVSYINVVDDTMGYQGQISHVEKVEGLSGN